MRRKVIIITEIISPYRIPVFNEIAKILGENFKVFFLSETEKRRDWKVYKDKIRFAYDVLPGISLQKSQGEPHFFNPGIFFRLAKESPDVVVTGGYQHPSYILALFYSLLFRKKFILWSEVHQRNDHPLKQAYKRWFIRRCNGYLVPGNSALDYILFYGAEKEKVWVAPDAVDNDYFFKAVSSCGPQAEGLRKKNNYPSKLILYVGRLIGYKGIIDLLEAFKSVSAEDPQAGLLFAGDGAAQEEYKAYCRVNIIGNVFFAGFIQQESLPLYYALAKVLVLPSRFEPWGLVLNEAMASGLPVIASSACGASRDLIQQGENGFVYRVGDIAELAGYLRDVLGDESRRIKMGKRSLDIISNYSPQKCAQGMIRAFEGAR
ncbi:MAG: glycosyltransferase family 4 protein [Candidatus Omnitrophica bacterium]|nr:glycosyltransferase family 4 protein [Candidatus Omnitrophota bacterium]